MHPSAGHPSIISRSLGWSTGKINHQLRWNLSKQELLAGEFRHLSEKYEWLRQLGFYEIPKKMKTNHVPKHQPVIVNGAWCWRMTPQLLKPPVSSTAEASRIPDFAPRLANSTSAICLLCWCLRTRHIPPNDSVIALVGKFPNWVALWPFNIYIHIYIYVYSNGKEEI